MPEAAENRSHDPACGSLPWRWEPRPGGVSDPFSLEDCVSCGDTFHRDGVTWSNWDQAGEPPAYLCACCARWRGLTVLVTRDGVFRDDRWTRRLVDRVRRRALVDVLGRCPRTLDHHRWVSAGEPVGEHDCPPVAYCHHERLRCVDCEATRVGGFAVEERR